MKLDGMRVLLAEDNPTNQMVAMQMLESLGADVAIANDGVEALEILEHESFDVALIDIEMPRISGIDLIRRLREAGDLYAGMPMIALTAYVMREHRAAIDEAGADGIIAKPILSIDQFGDEILKIVDHADRPVAAATITAAPPVIPDTGRATIDLVVFEHLRSSFDGTRRIDLMNKVSIDISDACERLVTAIRKLDYSEIRATTHVLISVSGAIGATRLQSLAQCLNSAGHATDNFVIDRDGPDLIAEAAEVLEFINRE